MPVNVVMEQEWGTETYRSPVLNLGARTTSDWLAARDNTGWICPIGSI